MLKSNEKYFNYHNEYGLFQNNERKYYFVGYLTEHCC